MADGALVVERTAAPVTLQAILHNKQIKVTMRADMNAVVTGAIKPLQDLVAKQQAQLANQQ
eukprot:12925135-Prorocentrum_lima.AAC.1